MCQIFRFLPIIFVLFIANQQSAFSQISFASTSCSSPYSNYTVNIVAVPVSITKTNNGGGCNMNVYVAYTITVTGAIPNGWCGGGAGGSLDNNQVHFNCSGGSFGAELGHTAGTGTVCACNNQGLNSVAQCSTLTLNSYCANANLSITVSGPGLSSSTKTLNNPLPIELLYFESSDTKDGVILNWSTASEINNDYFTIEKSNNINTWVEIGRVNGSGNSLEKRDYSFVDTKPYYGLNYYRLKQTDYNGSYKYSNVTYTDYSSGKTFFSSVYPNPSVSGKVRLNILNANSGSIFVDILDVTGQKVSSEVISTIEGGNTPFEQDISLPETGQLFFIVISQNNSIVDRHKVCVIRN